MGKALKDGRMLDLPLALPLCSLIVGLRRHDGTSSSAGGSPGGGNGGQGRSTSMGSGGLGGNAKPLTLVDVGLVDAALGRSLESLAKLAEEVQRAKVVCIYVYMYMYRGHESRFCYLCAFVKERIDWLGAGLI